MKRNDAKEDPRVPKGGDGSHSVLDPKMIHQSKRKVLEAYPLRANSAEMRWYRRKDRTVVIKIKKRFGKLEKNLKRVVGGTDLLRIPLDRPGTMVWELSDGNHNIMEICEAVYDKFKEEAEPVAPRILRFIEILLKRNLIILKSKASIEREHEDRKGNNSRGPKENKDSKIKGKQGNKVRKKPTRLARPRDRR